MDLSAFPQIASIAVICFIVGQALKTIDRLPTKYIPGIMPLLGIALAIFGHFTGYESLANEHILDCIATGIISGFGSSGIYSAYQNLRGNYEKCYTEVDTPSISTKEGK